MNCVDVDSLDPSIFNEVCVATDFLHNQTAFQIVQAALTTCCGSNNVFTTDDGCNTYCNITTPFDTVMLDNCLLDTLDVDTSDSINFDCYPFAWELSSTTDTSAGRIATTWTQPDQTVTATDSGIVVTETFGGSGHLLTGTSGSPVFTAATTTGVPAITTSLPPTGTGIITSLPTTSMAVTTSPPTVSAKSTSTAASPTSTKSSAGPGIRLSYKTGVLVALSILRLLL